MAKDMCACHCPCKYHSAKTNWTVSRTSISESSKHVHWCRCWGPSVGMGVHVSAQRFLFSVAPVRLAHLVVSRRTGPLTHTECHSTSRPASFPNGHSCPASSAEAPVPVLLSGRLPPLHLVSQRRGSATARRETTWHYWSSGSYAVPANPPTGLCKRDALGCWSKAHTH